MKLPVLDLHELLLELLAVEEVVGHRAGLLLGGYRGAVGFCYAGVDCYGLLFAAAHLPVYYFIYGILRQGIRSPAAYVCRFSTLPSMMYEGYVLEYVGIVRLTIIITIR